VPADPDLYGDVAGSDAYETVKLRGKEYGVPCVPFILDNMPSHSRTENRHGELIRVETRCKTQVQITTNEKSLWAEIVREEGMRRYIRYARATRGWNYCTKHLPIPDTTEESHPKAGHI
jgi:hypothetical protein